MLLQMLSDMRRKSASDPEKLNIRTSDLGSSSQSYLGVWHSRQGSRTKRVSETAAGYIRRSASNASKESIRSLQPILGRLSLPGVQQENLTACCVAGEHFITRSEGQSLLYQTQEGPFEILGESALNVDISDLAGSDEAMLLTQCLIYCHRVVLKPFTFLLLLMGWRPFRHGASVRNLPCLWKALNIFYPLLVLFLLIFYDSMLIYTCSTKVRLVESAKNHLGVMQNKSYNYSSRGNLTLRDMDKRENVQSKEEPPEGHTCAHVIPVYVVPALLHLTAYLYGFFHFRIQEHEQIYSLMEKVFIRSQTSWGVHVTLVKNSRVLLATVTSWMLLNISLEMFYNFTYRPEPEIFREAFGSNDIFSYTLVLFVMKCIGFLLLLTVHVAVLFNYCSQCEMLIMYINGLVMCLREKSLLLKEALHEILGVREYISVLNGALGKMTAICIGNYMHLTIIGLCFLIPFDLNSNGKEWAYRVAYPLVWIFGIAVPLIQGARLTKAGQQLRQVSFEMKVFGYQNCNNLELDSFVLFVSSATLRAKLFGVPVRPAILLLIFGGIVFFIVLFLIYKCAVLKNFSSLF